MPDSTNTSYGPAKSITWTPGNTKIATLNFFVVFSNRIWARLACATASITINVTTAFLVIRETVAPVFMVASEWRLDSNVSNYSAHRINIPYDGIDGRR